MFAGLSKEAAEKLLKAMTRVLHPDLHPPEDRPRAEEAFKRMAEAYEKYVNPDAKVDVTIHTRNHIYRVDGQAAEGTVSKLFWARTLDDKERHVLVKMPRSPKDNDLMGAEFTALSLLCHKGEDYEKFRVFFPHLREHFTHRDAESRIKRRTSIFVPRQGYYSLESILEAHPDGLNPRDVAWIFKRILTAIGYAHNCGVLHNALTPDNILVSPTDHHVIIVGWTYSTPVGTPMKAVVGRHSSFYPPEVTVLKDPHAGPESDIYMALKIFQAMGGSQLPVRLQRFAKNCASRHITARPKDAWALLNIYEDILYDLFGKPKYHELVLSTKTWPSISPPPPHN